MGMVFVNKKIHNDSILSKKSNKITASIRKYKPYSIKNKRVNWACLL